MEPSTDFKTEFHSSEVCKLKNALYGLKQSPRSMVWKIYCCYEEMWLQTEQSEHTLMFKRTEGRVTCLIIYVDDMIIIEDDTEEVSTHEKFISAI